ncbi:MAG TPA: CBS domain-containing protein [Alphaproteobacteria bacterium]|nr:CBS domain-containing protein [Alphaproteobacteria bacterium]
MNTQSDHFPDGGAARVVAGLEAEGAGVIDFAPQHLSADATLEDAVPLLAGHALWGVPLVDASGDYAGMVTLRSLVAAALPVALDTAPSQRRLLDRPAREFVDLEVPVVRVSTRLPQLLTVLCRRSPLIPIVPDTGMRLLGIASLERAAHALYRR